MPTPALHATPGTNLTSREKQILHLLANGYNYSGIAHELKISRHTVKSHMANIRNRLGAKTTTHAVAIWLWERMEYEQRPRK